MPKSNNRRKNGKTKISLGDAVKESRNREKTFIGKKVASLIPLLMKHKNKILFTALGVLGLGIWKAIELVIELVNLID